MKVIKNFFWNVGYQLFQIIVPLATVPYVSRVLGPTGLGINAFTNSVVQYFLLFGLLGLDRYGNRQAAYTRDNPDTLSQTLVEVSLARIICCTIAGVAYAIFVLLNNKYQLFYIFQGILILSSAIDFSWFFQGVEDFKTTVLRNIVVKFIALILIFTLIKTRQDVGLYILIMSLSQLMGSLTMFPKLRKYIRPINLSFSKVFQHIGPAFKLFIPQVAVQIYLVLNKTMLGVLSGVRAAGFYDSSDKIVKLLLVLVTSTAVVFLPHIANSFSRNKNQEIIDNISLSLNFNLFLAFPMVAGILVFSPWITNILFGPEFSEVSNLMAVESFVIIPVSIGTVLGMQYLVPTNNLRPYTNAVVLGALANIILNVPLIIFFSTLGAVVATVISETVVAIFELKAVWHLLPVRSMFGECWKYLLASVTMFLLIKTLGHFLAEGPLQIIILVLLGFASYILVLLFLRPRSLIHGVRSLINSHQ